MIKLNSPASSFINIKSTGAESIFETIIFNIATLYQIRMLDDLTRASTIHLASVHDFSAYSQVIPLYKTLANSMQ